MKFMVCYNGSEPAKAALELARKHATAMKAEIVAVTSMLLDDHFHAEEKKALEKELQLAKQLCEVEGTPFAIHQSGKGLEAADDLVAFAKQNQVDQIYIGMQKRSKLGKFIMGSTVQELLLETDCPVVVSK